MHASSNCTRCDFVHALRSVAVIIHEYPRTFCPSRESPSICVMLIFSCIASTHPTQTQLDKVTVSKPVNDDLTTAFAECV